jgi:hypothetical protein
MGAAASCACVAPPREVATDLRRNNVAGAILSAITGHVKTHNIICVHIRWEEMQQDFEIHVDQVSQPSLH